MGRIARVVAPDCWHHVTQRGNRRQTVFFDDSDRTTYLTLLVRHCARFSLRLTGYCLMGNHVHLLLVPRTADGLAKTLGRVHTDYSRWLNVRRGETGHVWQNRYYSCAFEGVRLASVMRYVELNPVRSALVRSASDYAWSSAVTHLGGTDVAELLDVERWRKDWTPEEWAQWLRESEERTDVARAIREATHAGRPLGSPEFVHGLEQQWERRLTPGQVGRPRKAQARGAA